MFFYTSWSKDVLASIKTSEWVTEQEIHRRVVDLRIGRGDWGLLTGLISFASPELAKSIFHFVTADRTMWSLALLAYGKEVHVRQVDDVPIDVITVAGTPLFEYCLSPSGSRSFEKRERRSFSGTPALA